MVMSTMIMMMTMMMMMTTTDDDADDDYKYDGHGGGDRDGDDYADDDDDEKDDEGYEDDCDATGIFKLDYLCDAFKVVFARLMASTQSWSCDLRMVTIGLLANGRRSAQLEQPPRSC